MMNETYRWGLIAVVLLLIAGVAWVAVDKNNTPMNETRLFQNEDQGDEGLEMFEFNDRQPQNGEMKDPQDGRELFEFNDRNQGEGWLGGLFDSRYFDPGRYFDKEQFAQDFTDKLNNDADFRQTFIERMRNDELFRNNFLGSVEWKTGGVVEQGFTDRFRNDPGFREQVLQRFENDEEYRRSLIESMKSGWKSMPNL